MKVVDITKFCERLDYTQPKQNCKTCTKLRGDVCERYNAIIQSNGHRPNDCKYWERNKK